MHFLAALASLASVAAAAATSPSSSINSLATSFKCPNTMSYCSWTRSCECPPGQSFDTGLKICVGVILGGAWPEPNVSVYASANVELGTFCAIDPYHIVPYDASHPYCQRGLDTIAFCAEAEIEAEIEALGLEVEIDVSADISATLKSTCAGLAAIYVDTVVDAYLLFNTAVYGFATVAADVEAVVSVSLWAQIKGLTCSLGLTSCAYDCVSYCEKGCKNYIDVDASLGARLTGYVGLAVLPDIIVVVDSTKAVVSIAVEGLLCIVGRLLTTLLSVFNCGCK